jgi:hypothetical protein
MRLTIILIALASLLFASATRAATQFADENGNIYPVGWVPKSYSGGLRSLPFGDGITSAHILTTALTMAPTQVGIQGLLEAGYLRRPDLDEAFNSQDGATAIIAFEAPTFSPQDKQPFVMVLTREDEHRFFTQAMSLVVQTGPDGSIILADTSGTGNAFIVPDSDSFTPLDQGGSNLAWSVAYDVKSADFPSDRTLNYIGLKGKACASAALNRLAFNMTVGAVSGVLSSIKGGPSGMTWGAAIGAATAVTNWAYDGGLNNCPPR